MLQHKLKTGGTYFYPADGALTVHGVRDKIKKSALSVRKITIICFYEKRVEIKYVKGKEIHDGYYDDIAAKVALTHQYLMDKLNI